MSVAIIYPIIIGFLLGFMLKRARFCFTGTLRDIYLEHRFENIWIFLTMIFVQAIIYFTLVNFDFIPAPEADSFSLFNVALGSLLFGFGAVVANGCCGIALVKLGDGRLTGWMTFFGFVLTAAASKQGMIHPISERLSDIAVVETPAATDWFSFSPIIIAMIGTAIAIGRMYKKKKERPTPVTLPPEYSGFRHLFFEKIWSKEAVAILIGLLAGIAWLSSNVAGRNGGFGITTPMISWLNLWIGHEADINWTSYFIVGVVVGSLIATWGSQEFSFKGTNGKNLIRAFGGGALMGVGAIWAKGCIIGNGLVGTATLSLKAWWGLLFIVIGVWSGARLFYKQSV